MTFNSGQLKATNVNLMVTLEEKLSGFVVCARVSSSGPLTTITVIAIATLPAWLQTMCVLLIFGDS